MKIYTRNFLFLLAFILLPLAAKGQQAPGSLYLIPMPKQIEMNPGQFKLTDTCRIAGNPLTGIGLEGFSEILERDLGIVLLTDKGPRKGNIRVEKRKVQGLGSQEEGYRLEIEPTGIRLSAPADAGLFYGIQTLAQIFVSNNKGRSIPCMTILDYPDIPVRGWQEDISRGPIPTMEYLKRAVRVLSSFKLNALTLYTEDVFRLKKHPSLAPQDGITTEQIAELSAYAANYHIQVIGNFQSFGHLQKILSKPGYEHLAESGHILTPTKEESYQFLKEVYSEVVPAYSSPYFHINCDETFGLGETLSKAMADSIGIAGIYGYHINRLNDLLKPYQKRILMWGDIASDPAIVRLLPRDITVIAWGYHDAPSFEYAIHPFSDQKLNFWVAPGVSGWGNVFPNLHVATLNINNYIRDGYKLGAMGVLNTSWMDDGLNFAENNWYGFIWGAEKSWNPPVGSIDQALANGTDPGLIAFDQAFDRIFFGTEKSSAVAWMKALAALHRSPVRGAATNNRVFEPVYPFFPEYIEPDQLDWNNAILTRLDSLEGVLPALQEKVKANKNVLDYLEFALQEVRFTAHKNMFRVELHRYLEGFNGALAPESLKTTLKILIRQSEQLKTRYAELWRQINREWWLDKNMDKFDQLTRSLRDLRGMTLLNFSDTLSEAGRMVSMRSLFDKLPVFYTLDGSVPGSGSMKYQGPVVLHGDAIIRARVIAEGREFPETADSVIRHKAIGRLHKLNSSWSTYHPAYDAGGPLGLLDGRTGNVNDIRSGRWQGFSGQDLNIEIDLGRKDTVRFLSMGFYQTTFSWVILPRQLDIYCSDDGNDYRLVRTLTHEIPVDRPDALVHRFETQFDDLRTRFLKVVGVYYGPLPEWHASKGEASMLFADELIIR